MEDKGFFMRPLKNSYNDTKMFIVIDNNLGMYYIGWKDDSLDCLNRWMAGEVDVSDLIGDWFAYVPKEASVSGEFRSVNLSKIS